MSQDTSQTSRVRDRSPVTGHRSRLSGDSVRIAITGAGSINALGVGVEAFAEGLHEGRCGIGELTVFPSAGFRSTMAAEVHERCRPGAPRSPRAGVARTGPMALTAALEAWWAAGLRDSGVGVLLGTTTGGMATGEEAYRTRETSRCGLVGDADQASRPISSRVPSAAAARA